MGAGVRRMQLWTRCGFFSSRSAAECASCSPRYAFIWYRDILDNTYGMRSSQQTQDMLVNNSG